MITPAKFEDAMKDYEEQLTHHMTDRDAVKRKATEDVIFVLKQYGYDAGAEIYKKFINSNNS